MNSKSLFSVQVVLARRGRERVHIIRTYHVMAINGDHAMSRVFAYLREMGETREAVRIHSEPNSTGIALGHVGTVAE